jgi:hypothetical protein
MDSQASSGYSQPDAGYTQAQSASQPAPGYQQASQSAQPAQYAQTTPPPQYTQPAQYSQYGQIAPAPKKESKAPVIGFICAMVGLATCFSAIIVAAVAGSGSEVLIGVLFMLGTLMTVPAIIFGIIGLKNKKKGMAIASLILGVFGILAFVGLLILGLSLI